MQQNGKIDKYNEKEKTQQSQTPNYRFWSSGVFSGGEKGM